MEKATLHGGKSKWRDSEKEYEATLTQFFDVITLRMNNEPGIYHRCTGRCRPNCVASIVDAIKSTLLKTLPGVPSPSKWTRLGRPLDIFTLGIAGSNIEDLLFEIDFDVAKFATTSKAEGGDDEDEVQKIRRVNSSRLDKD